MLMKPSKIKYVIVITFVSSFLLIHFDLASAQLTADSPPISEKELRQAKKEQGLLGGRFFQDSTSKKWFLEDREGNTYKFDEITKKWKQIEEASTTTAMPEATAHLPTTQPLVITDKYYVAVKTLKVMQQPERGAKEVGSLDFRTKVEKLTENDEGWMQVRQRETNLTGWVSRPQWNLEKYPLERPRVGVRKKKVSGFEKEAKPEAM